MVSSCDFAIDLIETVIPSQLLLVLHTSRTPSHHDEIRIHDDELGQYL
jgi:hypothetical protein